jgi:hypothetical protein
MSDLLLLALRRALRQSPDGGAHADAPLARVPGRGVAHDFVAVGGTMLLLRVPVLSQWGLSGAAQLAYEAAAFARAQASGATPRLFGTLAPRDGLPMGALIVARIDGRKARLPGDLAAIAQCLARIHLLPVPAATAPLLVHDDPVAETLRAVREQAAYLGEAGLAAAARARLEREIDAVAALAAGAWRDLPRPRTLVGTDTHPGNYLIEAAGRAWFVDVEKALYGSPAIDLAHVTLPTSTLWDPDIATILQPQDVRAFEAAYADAAPELFGRIEPSLAPMRRLIWLRTTTWCARWRALARRGGDWSAGRLAPDHRGYLDRTVERFLAADWIAARADELRGVGP